MTSSDRTVSLETARAHFTQGCKYFNLEEPSVIDIIVNNPAKVWAELLGGGTTGGRAASFAARSLAKIECAKGNHAQEVKYALAVATEVITDETPSYRDAWCVALRGLNHLARTKNEREKRSAYERMYYLALRAITDLDARLQVPGKPVPSLSGRLDDIVEYLSRSEDQLQIVHCAASRDFLRRQRGRETRKKIGAAQTFHQKHTTEIHEFWRREYLSWYTGRYRAKFGREPPDDLFIRNPQTIIGYQVRPGMMHVFDSNDRKDFFNYAEALYRQEKGLPPRGESYVSQTFLLQCVKTLFPNDDVLSEARMPWLGAQRLDIFIPSLQLAIEYQGEQHYFPFDHLGGNQGLRDRLELDQRKRSLCQSHGIRLIVWSYRDQITLDAVRNRLQEEGVLWNRG